MLYLQPLVGHVGFQGDDAVCICDMRNLTQIQFRLWRYEFV